jgi:putative SOS response-associated peptidase YedK
MCGRYSETVDPMQLAEVLAIDLCTYEFSPRPVITHTQAAPVIVRENGQTELKPMSWGLIPHWANDEKIGHKLFNARSETAAQKPAFREAWRQRRCLVPADGFYEWNHLNLGFSKKQPFHFHLPDRSLFCFAGLWERWQRPPARQTELFAETFKAPVPQLETFTILTAPPNADVEPYHDRMPLIIDIGKAAEWITGPSANLYPSDLPLEVNEARLS